ncbi:MAG: protein translocase subunit SecF [Syntrophomonadaceae bacterium]|jgi:preprotein translocase subunit SecF|nr:protein translocase subunit SecF [Syntrophomonadaceae bacterium]MDH7498051.1 protein translocase subunit SecF [Syntrophomonadaceae bacterium]
MRIIENRKWYYLLSLLIIIPGIVSLFLQGLNLGIDFTGGSMLQLRFEKAVHVDQVRGVLATFGREDSTIQLSGSEVFIRTRMLSESENEKLLQALNREVGKVELLRNEAVGPAIGRELTAKALYAVLIAVALMLVYITFRFELSFGLAAVLALIHDALVVLGVFSLVRLEVDGAFVAAVLTVLGYSIHDSIVVFDRIRENLGFKKKGELIETVNKSIMQTLNRSINTVLTVVFVLVSLLIFGGGTIKVFIIALLVGVITGCYSSIFMASPVYYDLKLHGVGGRA